MRIALFSGNYNYLRDGANQALNHLVRYLEGQGDQVRVYSPVTRRPAFEPSGALVPVPSVPVPGRGEYRLALGLPRSVRRDVERFSPHIIHVSAPDLLGTRAQTFAKRLDLPIVASLHTRFETYFDYYGLGWLKPALKRHLRRFYRRSDHVLAPTAALVQEMAKLRGDEQVSLWSRGVDRSLFDPARRDIRWRRARGFSDDEVVVLFFGRLVIEKGVETFISVVRDLQSRNVRVRPLVVGEGPARSAFAGLPGAVLTGHLEGRELGRAVASADILLNPSTTEAFGNVVLEAMASGLAVVSADAPSASALIEHGRTGLLCPPQDVASYGTAALSLISCETRRQQLGTEARAASRSYSWSAASAGVAQAYRAICQSKEQRGDVVRRS
jgi:glycosyltransferase involved in cell wall biosynthesis